MVVSFRIEFQIFSLLQCNRRCDGQRSKPKTNHQTSDSGIRETIAHRALSERGHNDIRGDTFLDFLTSSRPPRIGPID